MYISTLTPKPQQQVKDRNNYFPEMRIVIEDGKNEPVNMVRREINGGNVVEIEFTEGEPTPFRFSE